MTAAEELRAILPPGTTVQCVLRHVSRSGMSRSISLFVAGADGLTDITWRAAQVLGERTDKRDGIRMGGCGMDMGFALVYNLAGALYPNGYGCIGERCPSNDHANGDRDYALHKAGAWGTFAGKEQASGAIRAGHVHWHRSGGYALRHRWI